MRTRLAVLVALVTSVGAIAWAQPRLVRIEAAVKERSDIYALPPPEILRKVSFGYRAALADYLWAHVLVTQGLRMGERRPFTEIAEFVDAINCLDPTFREPYRLADSIMSFQINDPNRVESLRRARQVLERGVMQFPYDAELWLNFGQFLAYIGFSMLPPESKERSEWREDGARAIVRAGELGGTDENIYKSMSAAAILNRQGEIDAAIRFMERLFAMTEDDVVREDIGRRLAVLRQGRRASRDFELSGEFDRVWRRDLPFASRTLLSVLGPHVDPWACTGPRMQLDIALCDRDWPAWSEHALRRRGAEP